MRPVARVKCLFSALALALLGAAGPLCASPPALPLDEHRIALARFGGDAAWYEGNIPFFDASDPLFTQIWYYRWAIYRAHQRDLGAAGYITTEFFDDVGWQRAPFASLNDASAFHIQEGRWLRQRRYAGDYINYLYDRGGNDRHFSEAIADAVWARYLADGDRAAATRHLAAMRRIYAQWDDHFDPARGLYWIEPLLDATEYSVASIDSSGGQDGFRGGEAFRPSINSYMVANARAISRLSALAGDADGARAYGQKADALRGHMLEALWSPALAHFVDRYRTGNAFVTAWGQIDARELVGYLPWAYGVVGADRRYDGAWAHLLNPAELAGPHGLRTAEPSYRYYMRQYRYDAATGQRECQWNGPVWPFQTTQALMAMERLLHERGGDAPVSGADYLRLMRQYAALHLQGGRADLEEDYDPATGAPIVGLARSHHYFHSAFNDLVVTGLVGLEPAAGNRLVIDPLGAGGLDWFALQDLPYHGHRLTVIYDRQGTHYGRGRGLLAYVDGRLAERGERRLVLSISPRANPAPPAPIDLAVQLQRGGWPHVSASSGNDAERLHQVVDGRISFFPELPNGWVSAGGAGPEWLRLTFPRPITLRRAELAFGRHGGAALPGAASLWVPGKGGMRRLAGFAGGEANVHALGFAPVRSDTVLLRVAKTGATPVNLVEIKLF